MAVTEPERLKKHQGFIETMGEEQAARLMAHLPTTGWADVATKEDLDGLRAATKQDIEALRLATKQDIEGLRRETKQDIEGLREVTELRFAKADAELKAGLDGLRAEMHKALGRQTFTLIGATCAIGGLTLGLAHWV